MAPIYIHKYNGAGYIKGILTRSCLMYSSVMPVRETLVVRWRSRTMVSLSWLVSCPLEKAAAHTPEFTAESQKCWTGSRLMLHKTSTALLPYVYVKSIS